MVKNKILKNNKVRMLLIIEIIILLLGFVGLFRGDRVVLTEEEMDISILAGEYVEGKGYVIDSSYDYAGTYLRSSKFELSPGVYELRIHYSKTGEDVASAIVLNNNSTFYGFRSSLSTIFQEENINKSQFYVLDGSDAFQVAVNVPGTDEMTVSNIEIVQTNAGSRILLFVTFLGSLFINGLVWIYFYLQEKKVSREVKATWIAIPIITILASVPLFTDYIILGTDTTFYLKRIEMISYQMSIGSWSLKSILLTIPALFRLIGFPMLFAYGMYIFLLNLLSSIIAFLCMDKCLKNTYLAIMASAVYTLLPYRVNLIYKEGDIGTLVELLFLPLLVLLFLQLFRKDNYKYILTIFSLTFITVGSYVIYWFNEGNVIDLLLEEMSKITVIKRLESWVTMQNIGLGIFVGSVIFLLVYFDSKEKIPIQNKESYIGGMLAIVLGVLSTLLNFKLLGVMSFIVPTLLAAKLLLELNNKKQLYIYIATILGVVVSFSLYQTNSILLTTSNTNFKRGYVLDAMQTKQHIETCFSHAPFFSNHYIVMLIFFACNINSIYKSF